MTSILSAFSLNFVEVTLFSIVLLLSVITFVSNKRRINRLENRLEQAQALLTREIKMVNQGAIGVGRRFAQVEKKIKSGGSTVASFSSVKPKSEEKPLSNASKFAQIQQQAAKLDVQKPKRNTAAPKGLTTKAEQTLTSWLKEQQTA
ncbi:hypothetical protein QWZ13_08990 [Reinekea marina]|uniref:DUF948 domain-containing protein n=1 Tax=Reinekea marina TaxID=1310421 RepID=A0ABV7WTD4_9GAMM|nr:hypothetical protein [Reinekea marina]MDN3649042.1 hypothetical protein [Reinekea marina]